MMDDISEIHMFDQTSLQNLLVVYSLYVFATASPGPSTMAIMATAMHRGRAAALAFAGGVITGSIFWATLAATGISVLLTAYAHAILAIKIAGGLYLLWLAWKSARSALRSDSPGNDKAPEELRARTLYTRGLMLHLTNPKSILAWIAIMALGLGKEGHTSTALAIIGGCAVLGIIIFGGYALVFSTAPMVRLYRRARRWIEGALAAAFAYAGLRLLLSRT